MTHRRKSEPPGERPLADDVARVLVSSQFIYTLDTKQDIDEKSPIVSAVKAKVEGDPTPLREHFGSLRVGELDKFTDWIEEASKAGWPREKWGEVADSLAGASLPCTTHSRTRGFQAQTTR